MQVCAFRSLLSVGASVVGCASEFSLLLLAPFLPGINLESSHFRIFPNYFVNCRSCSRHLLARRKRWRRNFGLVLSIPDEWEVDSFKQVCGSINVKLMRDRIANGGERRIPQGTLDMMSDTWELTPNCLNPVSILLVWFSDHCRSCTFPRNSLRIFTEFLSPTCTKLRIMWGCRF